MDSDILVGLELTEGLIELGRKFLNALDNSGLHAKAMFWQGCPALEDWDLYVVFPDAEDWDPLPNLRHLLGVYHEQHELRAVIGGLGLATMAPSDLRYRELKECLDWNGSKLGMVNEDLYVYRAD